MQFKKNDMVIAQKLSVTKSKFSFENSNCIVKIKLKKEFLKHDYNWYHNVKHYLAREISVYRMSVRHKGYRPCSVQNAAYQKTYISNFIIQTRGFERKVKQKQSTNRTTSAILLRYIPSTFSAG